MKRNALWFVALALLIASWPATAAASPPADDPGWWAEYYSNPGLHGGASLTRHESSIDYDWGTGAPASGLPADRFSVRWTRTTHFDAGPYTFCVTVDDGARVWVDGHLIIDEWKLQGATTYCASKNLSNGAHTVQMAYFENMAYAVAKLWWTAGDGPQPPHSPGPSYPPGPSHPPGPPQPPPPDQPADWHGEYFDNKDLSGSPELTRTDTDLRFDWGTGAPASGLSADDFSVRWTADVDFQADTYDFFARHDDGVRVWVDGALIIDSWHDQPATTHSGTRTLSADTHHIRVEYYEHTGLASLVVWWSTDGLEPPDGPPHRPPDGPPSGPPGGPGGRVIVDNTDPDFLWGGPLRSREVAQLGMGNNLYWTYNTTFWPVNYGRWTPQLPIARDYEVFVHIPGRYATSTKVRYRVLHNGERHDRIVDQSQYSEQWVSLGTYYFNAANRGKEFVLVYDNTREPKGRRMIAFDAVQFIPN
jgi:hypothetical protein